VATELRENLVCCLHLVLSAKRNALAGTDDFSLKEQAVRLYYSQQQRVLTLICLLFNKHEQHQLDPDSPSQTNPAAANSSAATLLGPQGQTLCERVCQAVRYTLERYTHTDHFYLDNASKFYKHKRKGLETELRLLCEMLQEWLRSAIDPAHHMAAVDSVVHPPPAALLCL
jgi:hypothetical protein